MRIHVYTVCHNEEILLPYFLRHYGSFAERVIVFDGESTDQSREIISSHPRACLVRSSENPFDNGLQFSEQALMDIRNNAYKGSRGKADWIIVCDVDEFVYHPGILELLANYSENGITLPKVQGFEMVSTAPPSGAGQIYDQIRFGFEAPLYSKHAVFHPDMEINYDYGCHKCSPAGNVKESPQVELKLLHYRLLGKSFFVDKYLSRGKRMSAESEGKGLGCHVIIPGQEAVQVYPATRKTLKRAYDGIVAGLNTTDVVGGR